MAQCCKVDGRERDHYYTQHSVVTDYLKHLRFTEALNFAERIPFALNETLFVLVFKTCASLCDEKAKTVGMKLFQQMPTEFLDDDIVMNTAIHMLMAFRDVRHAERLFEQAKKKTSVTYSAMMQGE